MKKSITKNYIYNLIYQIIIIILPLITAPYIARVLGAENIGIYSYTISIATYFILFGSLGIAMYGQREIAYLQNEPKKYTKTFFEIVILRIITITISMIIFYFTFVNSNQYQLYYGILMLEIFANCLDISWFFQGLEEFKKIVFRNTIVKFISVISIFLLVKSPNDLVIYFWIYVLSTLIGNISLWRYLPKFLEKINLKEINIWKHLKPVIVLFIPQIAIQIYTVLDKTMLGSILNDMTEVGYYEQAQKIIKILMTLVTSLSTVMIPRIAKCFAENNKEQIKKYMLNSFNFIYLLAIPMIFGIIATSNKFVPIFFGEGYDKVSIIMNVMSLIILFIGFSGTIGNQLLLGAKRQKEFTISVVLGATINCLLNLLLIGRLKSIGATIATVIAEFSVTAIQFVFIRKQFKINEIVKISIKYIASSIVMFVVCLIVGKLINNNLYSLIIQVSIGVLVYIACLLLLKDKFIYSIFDRIKSRLKINNQKYIKRLVKIFIVFTIIAICVICFIYSCKYYENNKKYDIQLMSGWSRYQETPIIGNENTGSIFDPNVIKDENGNYRMYVSWRNEGAIAVTTSTDGINWTELKIVLEKNTKSGWEDAVNRATVIYKDGMYYMWYTGQANNTSKIGYAVSNDGYKFERRENPILKPEENYETQSVMNPYVIYDEKDNIYKMWYAAGETYEPDVLAYATSTNGIDWIKYEKNPIFIANNDKDALDNYKVGACEVKKINQNEYVMFYIGYSDIHTARIFVAKSNNGITNWNRNSKTPIISPSKGKFDSEACYKPSAIWDEENQRWLVYYNGRTEHKEYIGLYIFNSYNII